MCIMPASFPRVATLILCVAFVLAATVPSSAFTYDNRIGVTYSGTIPCAAYGSPQISARQTLYYLFEASPPLGEDWGTYELHEVNLVTFEDTITDVFLSDGNIALLDNGAVFVMIGDDEYYGMYWNISDKYRRDTRLKTANGHDAYTLVFSEWMSSYKQIFSYNALTGKSSMVTTSNNSHGSPRISGNTVVYEQYDDNWNIYCSDVSGGPAIAISSLPGDEADPRIDGTTIVFSHVGASATALYATDLYGMESIKLSSNVGEYAFNNGHVLYYDAQDAEWVVYCFDTGYFHIFDDAGGDTDDIAVSERWACIGGRIYKLYDSPSVTIPSTTTPVPSQSVTETNVPSETQIPTTPAPPCEEPESGNGGHGAGTYAALLIVLALVVVAGWYVSKYTKKNP